MKRRKELLLVVCGAVLMLSQYIAVREVGSTFFSTEIITLMTVVMMLIGPSIAYFMVDKVSDRVLLIWSLITFFVLLTLPFGLRYLVALMRSVDLELLSMVVIFLGGSLFCSAFFAIFLPKYAKTTTDFKTLYALELSGSMLALVSIAVIGNWVFSLYLFWFLIVLSIFLSFENKVISGFTLIVAALVAINYTSLDSRVSAYFFEQFWDKENPVVLETVYSPYQRVDVVKAEDGKSLYLDGVPYYETGDLHWFNYYISELPGELAREKKKALIVGSGTLSSTGYLVRQGYDVTTVDIDSVVADMGRRYFSDVNKLDGAKFRLEFADARRFVRTLPDNELDLIVLDIPAPYHVQTALLYVPSFYKDLKRCLKPEGVVAVNTCAYKLDDGISSSIAKSVVSVFADVVAVRGESLALTILYCGEKLPFSTVELNACLRTKEKKPFVVYDGNAVRALVSNVSPHTEDNLSALLLLARYQFPESEKWLKD